MMTGAPDFDAIARFPAFAYRLAIGRFSSQMADRNYALCKFPRIAEICDINRLDDVFRTNHPETRDIPRELGRAISVPSQDCILSLVAMTSFALH